MGTSRIEQIIEDIYDFVESCKPKQFSSSRVIVPKDELYDLLDELKLRTPDEIKRYQKIIANRDTILADAEKQAEAITEEARLRTDSLINESEIMQQAYDRANEVVLQAQEEANRIVQGANQDANEIRTNALIYAEQMLGEVEKVIGHAFESTRSRCENLVETLHGNLQVLSSNRNELVAELYGQPAQEAAATQDRQPEQGEAGASESESYPDEEYDDEEVYNIEENAFLKHIE
ncbi:MAG: ATPase [Lachnospiraceae bacterium]|jgi:vacuolar-type H+-ATPase subunit H|nr:ATPase [Lachnospiraceae bacterium]